MDTAPGTSVVAADEASQDCNSFDSCRFCAESATSGLSNDPVRSGVLPLGCKSVLFLESKSLIIDDGTPAVTVHFLEMRSVSDCGRAVVEGRIRRTSHFVFRMLGKVEGVIIQRITLATVNGWRVLRSF